MIGFGEAISTNFDNCFDDSSDIISKTKEAIQDFELKSLKGTLAGLKVIAEIAHEVPDAMSACGAVKEELFELKNTIAALANPESFIFTIGKDIIVNRKQLYQDVQDMISSQKAGDYLAFGKAIGNSLEKLLTH